MHTDKLIAVLLPGFDLNHVTVTFVLTCIMGSYPWFNYLYFKKLRCSTTILERATVKKFFTNIQLCC